MAEEKAAPSFSAFLFAAALAGVSIGGSLLLTWIKDDKETVRQLSSLSAEIAHNTKELDKLSVQQETIIGLGIRVTIIEGEMLRQNLALEELRKSRVPTELREYRR